MARVRRTSVALALLVAAAATAKALAQSEAQPAAAAFDKLKALAGDRIDIDGAFGMPTFVPERRKG